MSWHVYSVTACKWWKRGKMQWFSSHQAVSSPRHAMFLQFVCKIYKCTSPPWDMTAAIREQKLWHNCHDSRALGAGTHASIPRVELSRLEFDKQKKGRASDQGKCSPEWDSRSVLLYWCSLVSGFLSEHSLLSASEMPPSPISRDDSPPLRSRGGAPGAFDNSLITAGAIYPFLIALLWVKEHSNFSHERDWSSDLLSRKIKSINREISCKNVREIQKKHNISSKKTILPNKAVMRCTVKRKAGHFLTES